MRLAMNHTQTSDRIWVMIEKKKQITPANPWNETVDIESFLTKGKIPVPFWFGIVFLNLKRFIQPVERVLVPPHNNGHALHLYRMPLSKH